MQSADRPERSASDPEIKHCSESCLSRSQPAQSSRHPGWDAFGGGVHTTRRQNRKSLESGLTCPARRASLTPTPLPQGGGRRRRIPVLLPTEIPSRRGFRGLISVGLRRSPRCSERVLRLGGWRGQTPRSSGRVSHPGGWCGRGSTRSSGSTKRLGGRCGRVFGWTDRTAEPLGW